MAWSRIAETTIWALSGCCCRSNCSISWSRWRESLRRGGGLSMGGGEFDGENRFWLLTVQALPDAIADLVVKRVDLLGAPLAMFGLARLRLSREGILPDFLIEAFEIFVCHFFGG